MNDKRGFTLVEVIIAIGILMLASGFILQIFMTAKNLNDRAHAVDQSVSITTNFVETIKAAKDPMALNYEATFPQSEVTKNQGSVRIKFFYNENWTLVKLSEKKEAPYTFIGFIEVTKNNMLDIEASVLENRQNGSPREVFKIEAGQWEGSEHE